MAAVAILYNKSSKSECSLKYKQELTLWKSGDNANSQLQLLRSPIITKVFDDFFTFLPIGKPVFESGSNLYMIKKINGEVIPVPPMANQSSLSAIFDSQGTLHLFWAESIHDSKYKGIDTLYSSYQNYSSIKHAFFAYTHWKGGNEIYRGYNLAHFPSSHTIGVDDDGVIHLVFFDEREAPEIIHIRNKGDAWITSRVPLKTDSLVAKAFLYPDIDFGSDNEVFISFVSSVYDPNDKKRLNNNANSILMIRSNDNGHSWQELQLVHLSRGRAASQTQLLVRDHEVLDIFWLQAPSSGVFPEDIAWIHSEDHGHNFTEPIIVSPPPDNYPIHSARIIEIDKSNLLLVFSAAGNLWYSYLNNIRSGDVMSIDMNHNLIGYIDLCLGVNNELHLLWQENTIPDFGEHFSTNNNIKIGNFDIICN